MPGRRCNYRAGFLNKLLGLDSLDRRAWGSYKFDGSRNTTHLVIVRTCGSRGKSVRKHEGKTRWNVERRLQFIDFRLFWEGHINRADLVRFFGISVPQTSADLSQYQQGAEGNVEYDKTAKTYRATPRFKPVFFTPSADRYLAQLRMLAAGLLTEEEAWAAQLPEFSVVPILRRSLGAKTLRIILEAIRKCLSLEVSYQSFSNPEPRWRRITPHALGFDGFRWHARAWCHSHGDFRDFVLARVLAVRGARPSDIDTARDIGWHAEVTLRLGPHPDLKDGQRRAIELDFGMEDGVVEVTTRLCLSYYLERQLGLDLDPSKVPAARQQIVLLNRGELEAARTAIGPASCARPQEAP
jgi:hypothetical protein